jgi:trimeric autotransporter adhesin
MAQPIRPVVSFGLAWLLVVTMMPPTAAAEEIWVAPSHQLDIGGLGIGSNFFWPATPVGAVRLAWAVPNDLQAFLSARIALIPDAPGGAASLVVFVCAAADGELVGAACAGPFPHAFVGGPNQLMEVDISADIASRIGTPGQNHLAVFAYTTPTTATDHLVGLRFTYRPVPPVVTSGNVSLPATTSGSSGVLTWGGSRFLHRYGTNNLFLGASAGNFTMSGGENAAVGLNTLQANQTGNYNTALGNRALLGNTTGSSNTAVGAGALSNNTTAGGNTAVGTGALASSTTAEHNTAVGYGALGSNVEGDRNTALGMWALLFNTSGRNNTAIGVEAMGGGATGFFNTAVGTRSLYGNSGQSNVGLGHAALEDNTGNFNAAGGVLALGSNTTGEWNTAFGYKAGQTIVLDFANRTGSNNTFIGALAGPGTTTQLTNATAVGAGALVTASNALVLGSSGVNVGVGTTAPVARLQVVGNIRIGTGSIGCVQDNDGTVIAGTCSSDARLKRNVEPFGAMLDRVARLQPVYFDWNGGEYPDLHLGPARSYGLIAQEVEAVLPELVTEDEHGLKAVKYGQLPLVLLQALKDQQARIDQLVAEIIALKARVGGKVE